LRRGRQLWQTGKSCPSPCSYTRCPPSRLGHAPAALRLRGGATLAGKQAGRGGPDRQGAAAGAEPRGVEMPVFRYVPYDEKVARRSGGDHRNSKWRKDPRERAEEKEEAAAAAQTEDIDVEQLLKIDEDKVAALLQRQHVSAKSLRRKRARKRAKDTASTLEEVARFDPRKRTAEEWIDAEMRGQSFHEMRQQVIETRTRQDLREKQDRATGSETGGGGAGKEDGAQDLAAMEKKLLAASGSEVMSEKSAKLGVGKGKSEVKAMLRKALDEDADFDPAHHERLMAQMFGKEYYGEQGDDTHPFEGQEVSGLSDDAGGGLGGGWRPRMGEKWLDVDIGALGGSGPEGGGREEAAGSGEEQGVDFECEKCGRLFATESVAELHEAKCTGEVKEERTRVEEGRAKGKEGRGKGEGERKEEEIEKEKE